MSGPLLLRVDTDEYAEAVPGSPGEATVVSAGALPWRVPVAAGGVHHRPRFAGTTVQIADVRYEVVAEQSRADGRVTYALKPWPPDQIIRELVTYDRALIEAVRAERLRMERRERGHRLYWPLYPLLGALPEEQQIRWCDRWGLSPLTATCLSAAFEIVLVLALWGSQRRLPGLALAGVVFGIVFVDVMRIVGAVITREVTGSPLAGLFGGMGRLVTSGVGAPDVTLLPLTRPAFWARLALPDRQKRESDGALTVRSVLPHLSWAVGARVVGDDDEHWWRVAGSEVRLEGGRLLYEYRLVVEGVTEGDLPGQAPPPRTLHYQDEVMGGIRREWDDVRAAFGWLATLLPETVQARAFGHVGGPAAARAGVVTTVLFEIGAAAWMAAAPSILNLATAAVLGADAAWRLWRAARGRYAPSLLARWAARYLRPERVAYHAHRDAERTALDGR